MVKGTIFPAAAVSVQDRRPHKGFRPVLALVLSFTGLPFFVSLFLSFFVSIFLSVPEQICF